MKEQGGDHTCLRQKKSHHDLQLLCFMHNLCMNSSIWATKRNRKEEQPCLQSIISFYYHPIIFVFQNHFFQLNSLWWCAFTHIFTASPWPWCFFLSIFCIHNPPGPLPPYLRQDKHLSASSVQYFTTMGRMFYLLWLENLQRLLHNSDALHNTVAGAYGSKSYSWNI